ncbi:hypothetical protein BUQ74_09960 [Leptospira weilii serovar Heyan]|nr:hypothetical protein BUQ74_09960 [Leptospira weilii serovar Heyan]
MGRKFHRGFVVIPTDLSSDPSICGVDYIRDQHFSFLFAQTFLAQTHVQITIKFLGRFISAYSYFKSLAGFLRRISNFLRSQI